LFFCFVLSLCIHAFLFPSSLFISCSYAASVAGLLITTEGMVADRPEPKGAPGMPPGGMGGMGGMDY